MAVRILRDESDSALMGARVRHLRNERNMTLKELASRLGVSYQQIQKYEKGSNSMLVPTMKKIAAALEVDACAICGCCNGGNDA
jgi:transcriptional regulator with XRE-family HTH domain